MVVEDSDRRLSKAAKVASIQNIIHSANCQIPRRTLLGDHHEILSRFSNSGNKFTRWLRELNMISITNPLTQRYFRSETAVTDEKIRHIRMNYWYIIHPLSKLRIYFEIWQLLLYISVVVIKPMSVALPKPMLWKMTFFPELSTILDLLCWLTIICTFLNGYIIKQTKSIIVEPKRIAWHYVSSIYFICDVLSSIPVFPVIHFWTCLLGSRRVTIIGILYILSELKLIRIISIIHLINNLTSYFKIRNKEHIFLLLCVIVMMFTVHNCALLQLLVPKLIRSFFTIEDQVDQTWYSKQKLIGKSFSDTYTHCVFRSSAYILAIRLDMYKDETEEDYILAIVTYVLGKVLICTTYVILGITLLSKASMRVKFQSVICQLDEYMKQKQLPLDLRARINSYYNFKYQEKYFKEGMVHDMLSEKLKKEVNLHVCRSLIQNVSLFAHLTAQQASDVVELLIPEIFLPNDTIYQSGSYGDCMYFISSGTVAVYTHSGKEIWHLQDGDYFGEMTLVMKIQHRYVTVIAIETTQLYILKKKYFSKYLLKNAQVVKIVQKVAYERWLAIQEYETAYKKMLFEQEHGVQPGHSDHVSDDQ